MSTSPLTNHEQKGPTLYDHMMLHTGGTENDHLLAVVLSSWINREGVLPQFLGLEETHFYDLMRSHFPGFRISRSVRQDVHIDVDRMLERDDLIQLLHTYRANNSLTEIWIAEIITVACLGANHLWQDLGLWDRSQLSRLIAINFPALATKNNKNMKWKKFLYKQLCNEEGIYVCRAPSCEVCADYTVCFGSEE